MDTSTLLLIPTSMERDRLLDASGQSGTGPSWEPPSNWRLELCGFGPIAAAAVTSKLLMDLRPSRVILAGIAGTYSEELAVGGAARFDCVACDGVGVGEGCSFRSASEMGWQQCESPVIQDVIQLEPTVCDESRPRNALVSVCSASADVSMARTRFDRIHRGFKQTHHFAEDMEGYAVAVACRLARVPLQIIRGFSNRVGDRSLATWKIDEAMESVTALLLETD